MWTEAPRTWLEFKFPWVLVLYTLLLLVPLGAPGWRGQWCEGICGIHKTEGYYVSVWGAVQQGSKLEEKSSTSGYLQGWKINSRIKYDTTVLENSWAALQKVKPGVTMLCCAQLHPILCDPVDCNPPGSSVHGISQARTLGRLPFPSPGDLPSPGIEPSFPVSSALADGFFTTVPS